MAYIWIDVLEHEIEIWVSYFRLLSKVTPNTLILSDKQLRKRKNHGPQFCLSAIFMEF